jgi:biopolymer transport protein ExbD
MIRGFRRRKRNVARMEHDEKLRMTSMMDILVVLLLFLLKSFVVEGETVTPPPGIQLPQSTAEAHPEESIHVAILDSGILFSGELVATMDDVKNQDSYVIEALAVRLEEARAQSEKLARMKGKEESPLRLATVQGDKDMEFDVLQKVMYTLSRSGYEDISLAVIKKA